MTNDPSSPALRLPTLTDPPHVEVVALPPSAAVPVAAGEERVHLLAAELQPLDHQIARGLLPGVAPGLQPGTSAVGRVAATGRRVAVLGGSVGLGATRPGCFATWFDVPTRALVTVPDEVGTEAVAAGLGAATAAAAALEDHAVLQAGERVLVLGASGAVGRAAVALAVAAGAEVVALARDPQDLLDAPAGVRVGALGDLEDPVAAAALGEVDVIVDPLGGPWLAAAARIGARRCRHVLLGYAAGVSATVLVPALLVNEHRILAVNLHAMPLDRLRDLAAGCLRALADGRLRPVVGPQLPLERAGEAYATAGGAGRTLLVPG